MMMHDGNNDDDDGDDDVDDDNNNDLNDGDDEDDDNDGYVNRFSFSYISSGSFTCKVDRSRGHAFWNLYNAE